MLGITHVPGWGPILYVLVVSTQNVMLRLDNLCLAAAIYIMMLMHQMRDIDDSILVNGTTVLVQLLNERQLCTEPSFLQVRGSKQQL